MKFKVEIWETELVHNYREIIVESDNEETLKEMIKNANSKPNFNNSIVEYKSIIDNHYVENISDECLNLKQYDVNDVIIEKYEK